MPFHWGGERSINRLTNPALDPISRMPEFKVCAVQLQPALARSLHPRPALDASARICDCNGITRTRIVEAVLNGARSLQAVCDATKAGTGCGTCRPEVQTLIDATCRRLDMPGDEAVRRLGFPVAARATESLRRHRPLPALVVGPRRSLVVVGNGMAGIACVEQILKHAPQFDITIFGDETHVNYNRILLSSVLAGEKASDEITLNPLDWYRAERHPAARRRADHRRRRGQEDRHRGGRQRHALRRAAARHRQLGVDAADRRPRSRRRLRVPHARRHARAAGAGRPRHEGGRDRRRAARASKPRAASRCRAAT